MPFSRRLGLTAALSLVFTYLFFFEYLPPFRWADVTYDLQYFNYPLADFAFQSLRHGHLPEWDPSMYCGIPLAGNPQAALFYPPMWLVFAANVPYERLKYRSLEVMVLGHVWLAFLLFFAWLGHRGLRDLACILGAGVFAYGGYMMLQLSHMALVFICAWIPLGFLAIDQATETRDWRPLWKLSVAGALAILAGHPPSAFVFFAVQIAYAAAVGRRGIPVLQTCGALAVSVALALVQILPAQQAAALKEFHEAYGAGIRNPMFYVSYFIANFYSYGLKTSVWANPGREYLYLGAPGTFGLLWAATHPGLLRRCWPVVTVGAVSLIALTNPYDLVWNTIRHSDLLAQICRSWYFLAGVATFAAGLAAYAADDFLARKWRVAPRWMALAAALVLIAWSGWQLWRWRPSGPGFASGWAAGLDSAVIVAAFSAGLYVVAARERSGIPWLAVILALAVGVDFKVYGTSVRTNSYRGNVDHMFAQAEFPGMENSVYRQMRAHPEGRVGLDRDNPVPMDLRHYGLATPQGGDPLVPARYSKLLPPQGEYYGFVALDPDRDDLLQLFGVRYFLTSDEQPLYGKLKSNPKFQVLQPATSYMKVFEYRAAVPPYRWELQAAGNTLERTAWTAETREFAVTSNEGGRVILIEENVPGWSVSVDGQAAPLEFWRGVFQAVQVPAGKHRVRFEYKAPGLRAGAAIGGLTLLGMAVAVRRKRDG